MANDQQYQDWQNYFKQIAVQNRMIQHSDGAGQGINTTRFFSSDIDAFIIDQKSWATNSAADLKCFLHMINPQRNFEMGPNGIIQEVYQGMFFVMSAFKMGDLPAEVAARNRVDTCVNQILSRMVHDSKVVKHPLFKRSFDQIPPGTRITPYRIVAQHVYVGSQVSFPIRVGFDKCYESNDWTV